MLEIHTRDSSGHVPLFVGARSGVSSRDSLRHEPVFVCGTYPCFLGHVPAIPCHVHVIHRGTYLWFFGARTRDLSIGARLSDSWGRYPWFPGASTSDPWWSHVPVTPSRHMFVTPRDPINYNYLTLKMQDFTGRINNILTLYTKLRLRTCLDKTGYYFFLQLCMGKLSCVFKSQSTTTTIFHMVTRWVAGYHVVWEKYTWINHGIHVGSPR